MFGLLKALTGAHADLVRLFLADRVGDMARSASRMQVMGCPEASAMSISEALGDLIDKKGLSEVEAVARVEVGRSNLGRLPADRLTSDILAYVVDRVRLENPGVPGLSRQQILAAAFGGEHWIRAHGGASSLQASYLYGRLKALELSHNSLLSATNMLLDGECTDEEFFVMTDGELEDWRMRRDKSNPKRASIHLNAAINPLY